MQNCQATTKRGKPCRAAAGSGGLCFLHANPARARQLGRLGGSRNRKAARVDLRLSEQPTATDLRNVLTAIINAVLAAEMQPRDAIAVANLVKVQSSIIRDVDIENRVAELERASMKSVLQKQDRVPEQEVETSLKRNGQPERGGSAMRVFRPTEADMANGFDPSVSEETTHTIGDENQPVPEPRNRTPASDGLNDGSEEAETELRLREPM